MSALKSVKSAIRSALRACGVDLIRYSAATSADLRRRRILRDEAVTLVVDVGANGGQYGMLLRRDGYSGAIVSFEPLSSAYRELEKTRGGDPGWQSRNLALGAA